MLSGAIGFQILARRLGVELGKAQFSHIEGIDDNEITPRQIKDLAKKHKILCKAIKTNLSGLEKASKIVVSKNSGLNNKKAAKAATKSNALLKKCLYII